jgi:hypothetical protein
MAKSLDIFIKKKELVQIKAQLCPRSDGTYAPGTTYASAQPLANVREVRIRPDYLDVLPSLNGAIPPPDWYLEVQAGGVLRQGFWSVTSWNSTILPRVLLTATYSQQTGLVTVDVPFGLTFDPTRSQLDPGGSPRLYGYTVHINTEMVLNGSIKVDAPRPVTEGEISVCSATLGSGASAGAGAQQNGLWLVGG